MLGRQSLRLAAKKINEEPAAELHPAEVVLLSKAARIKKTSSQIVKDCMERMKRNDPEKYRAYKEKSKNRSKARRDRMTEDEKAVAREQSRIRMKAYRERKKAEQKTQSVRTRASQDEQRAKWREEKRKQKEKMHPQKLRRINEKRRQQYRAKKEAAEALKKNQNLSSKQTQASESFVINIQTGNELSIQECQEDKSDDLQANWTEELFSAEGSSKNESRFDKGDDENSENVPTRLSPVVYDRRTPEARRKAASRAQAALPASPTKFVGTISDIIKNCSPRKKKLFNNILRTPEHRLGEEVKKKLQSLGNSIADRKIRSVLVPVATESSKGTSKRKKSMFFGISRHTISKVNSTIERSKEKMKSRLLKMHVSSFFEQSAYQLPDKKLVSKKTGKNCSILTKPLKDLYTEFLETHPAETRRISFSKFAKCRPKHVRPMKHSRLRQCLCEYCTNAELLLEAVNKTAALKNNLCRIRHIYHAVDIVTCGRTNGSWRKECAYGNCEHCGVDSLHKHLEPLLAHQGTVHWRRWETRVVIQNDKRVSRKSKPRKEGTMGDLINQLKADLAFLAQHLFRAHWQSKQFDLFKKMLPFPRNTVGMVLDFAENFTCLFQDEIQAAHWHHEQVTVHPTVCYCACDRCDEMMTESLVFISEDTRHDYHAVFHFTSVAVDHLKHTRRIPLEHIVQWTDGCSSQYKSKGPFSDISCALDDFGCTFERNFFGSRHGKGPSDGESAVVKHHAATAVRSGKMVISSAKDLFDYCQASSLVKQPGEECRHFLRTFFWVGADEIQRNRHRLVKTVRGTRAFHTVKCVQQNTICTRHLSCVCQSCHSGIGECANAQLIGPWTVQHLQQTGGDPEDQPASPPVPTPDPEPAQPSSLDPHAPQPRSPAPRREAEPPGPQREAEDADQSLDFQVGDFVVIGLQGRQRTVEFYAKVTEMVTGRNDDSETDVKVRYLENKSGTTNLYTWSDSPQSWISHRQVLKKVPPPDLMPCRGIVFRFKD